MGESERKFAGQRKKKPRALAVVDDKCSGCGGAPVCQALCPVEECMVLRPAEDAYPFGRIWVDPSKCVGCKKCVADGPLGILVEGCPWDAIRMVPTAQWEKEHYRLPY
jgi:ferredoxin